MSHLAQFNIDFGPDAAILCCVISNGRKFCKLWFNVSNNDYIGIYYDVFR